MNAMTAPRRGASLGFWARMGIGGLAATTVLIAGASPVANAATDDGSTVVNVEVGTSITLSGLTAAFTLSGLSGVTVPVVDAVSFNVETNNIAGYNVTVQSTTATLLPSAVGNTDSIPIGALSVQGDSGEYQALSATAAATVNEKTTRSEAGGDDLTNDYRVVIPFVNSDTYSTTLTYVATSL